MVIPSTTSTTPKQEEAPRFEKSTAQKLLVTRALQGTARLRRFDSADDMVIPSTTRTQQGGAPTAGERAVVQRALRGGPLRVPRMRRFDSADYFSKHQSRPEEAKIDSDSSGVQLDFEHTIVDDDDDPDKTFFTMAALACLGVVVRYAVGLHPYSGEATPPRYGDYEAHRHWMELTVNLPLKEWYTYDVAYWGLDYPPVMAYVEYVLGLLSRTFDPLSVDLDSSRGYETPNHRAFMRGTVLVLDLALVVLPLALLTNRKPLFFASALSSPVLLLVDHGHFQYNCIPVGLTLWTVVALYYGGGGKMHVGRLMLAAVVFSVAVNSKQTALYYAPAIFFELLARCAQSTTMELFLRRLTLVGLATIGTFAAIWYPVYKAGALGPVLHRLFPVDRGVFEDKVGNFWYALQVVARARDRIGNKNLVILAAIATFLTAFPPQAYRAFRVIVHSQQRRRDLAVGVSLKDVHYPRKRRPSSPSSSSSSRGGPPVEQQQRTRAETSADSILLALHASALAFFLFSYHVHEKAILLPLAPLLALKDRRQTAYVALFSLFAAVSIFPLLCFEGLRTAYFATGALHLLILRRIFVHDHKLALTVVVVAVLAHGLPLVVPPPNRYPDLYPALVALASAVIFGTAWLLTTLFLLLYPDPPPGGGDDDDDGDNKMKAE